jgi:putative flippase GtrA
MAMLDLLKSWFPRAARALEPRLAIARKAVSFGLVGLVNAAIDFAVFWTAVHAFDVAKIPANVLGWMVAVSASYVMNSFTTFAAESGRKLRWRAYGVFVASGVAGMVASTAALVAADWVLAPLVAGEDLRLALAKVAAIGVSFLVNFSLSHFWVFRPRAGAAGEGR